jgi:hypothetical protein
MSQRLRNFLLLFFKKEALAFLVLSACSSPPAFTGSIDPVAFFTGHVTSWGVEEDRGGAPTGIVTTDCTGTQTGPGAIRMVQVLRVGAAAPQTRIWSLRALGGGLYEARANDMAGTTIGTASGRAFHWQWVLETRPGDPLTNVTMSQWFYQLDDGSVMIRTVVTKLSVRLIEVSEVFHKDRVAPPHL